jgi:hypothetical protein
MPLYSHTVSFSLSLCLVHSAAPYALIALLPLGVIFLLLRRNFVKASRQVKRLVRPRGRPLCVLDTMYVCMCIYIYMYIHVCMYAGTFVCVCMYAGTFVCVCMCVRRACPWLSISLPITHTHTHEHIYAYVHTYMPEHVLMLAFVYRRRYRARLFTLISLPRWRACLCCVRLGSKLAFCGSFTTIKTITHASMSCLCTCLDGTHTDTQTERVCM